MIRINKFFLVILLISIIFALVVGGDYTYLIMDTLVLALIAAFIHIMIIKSSLDVEVVFDRGYYSVGDKAECITKIDFAALIPVPYIYVFSDTIKYSTDGYIGELSNMTSDENKWIRSDVVFPVRGMYNLGRVIVECKDFFNILTYKYQIDKNIDVKVYPRLYNIISIESSGKDIFLDKLDKNSSNEDQSIIKDVRKYMRGDSIKKIHWKISAKYGELYVRNSETISGEEYVVISNMHKSNYEYEEGIYEEKVVELTASVVQHLFKDDIGCKVYINKNRMVFKSIDDKASFEEFMDYLVLNKSDGSMKFEEFIHHIVHNLHKSNKIILIAAIIDDSLVNSIQALKDLGFDFAIYYCVENIRNKELSGLLSKMGITILPMENVIDLISKIYRG